MAARFALPPEGRLEELILEAYERLPGPEPERMARIGDGLARGHAGRRARAGLNRMPWWIVIVILSGAAAAAWYAGETWRRGSAPDPEGVGAEGELRNEDGSRRVQRPEKLGDEPSSVRETNTNREDRPQIIYRREPE